MNRAACDNALLAAAYDGLGMLAKVSMTFAGGVVIGGAWYALVAFRAGVL